MSTLAARRSGFGSALRAHFYLDAPEDDAEARLRDAATEAIEALDTELSAEDRQRVLSALVDDRGSTNSPHRLVWRGVSRRYAPVGDAERFITPDLDERLTEVAGLVGTRLDPLARLERARLERFMAVPAEIGRERLTDAPDEAPSLVIESENLAALRYLTPRVRERVDLIYADPPYNSGERLFRYKDRYSPEAWLTMMRDRLEVLAPLLAPDGAAAFSINEAFGSELKLLCDEAFGRANFLTSLTVRVRHEDRIIKAARAYQDVTEQVLLYRASPKFTPPRRQRPARDDEYEWAVGIEGGPSRTESVEGRRLAFYAPGSFTLSRGRAPDGLKRINIRGALREANSSGRFFVAHLESRFAELRGWLVRVEGIGADGLGHRDFLIPPEGPRRNADYFQGRPIGGGASRQAPHANLADFERDFNRVVDEDGARFRNGKKPVSLLRHVMTLTGLDAKPGALVLDPFAGSGTTGAAVLALNGLNGSARRFVLIDQAEHLRSVTVPRLRRLLEDPAHRAHGVELVTLGGGAGGR